MNRKVSIYDTTLRDGAQGEGISFSSADKIRIAERLDAFGVHYIEGGWPGSNPKDMDFFTEVSQAEVQARADRGVRQHPPGENDVRGRPADRRCWSRPTRRS